MMRLKFRQNLTITAIGLLSSLFIGATALALGSSQNPQGGSLGLEATIPSPPPSQSATIAVPSNGQSFSALPVIVSGLCPNNLLVKILDNNIFVGSAACSNGSYSLKTDLFNGRNDLVAQDYDNLGQAGPASATVTVNFSDSQYIRSGSQVNITTNYAELGANPGQELDWPIAISGGTPPYAISTDWGDGQPSTLQTSSFPGNVTIKHTYQSSGIYQVTVTVTDSNGTSGFLQLVGIANGQINASSKTSVSKPTSSPSTSGSSIPVWILLVLLVALVPAFWLGAKHGRTTLLKKFQ